MLQLLTVSLRQTPQAWKCDLLVQEQIFLTCKELIPKLTCMAEMAEVSGGEYKNPDKRGGPSPVPFLFLS